jgi:hypothetical protein
MRGSFFCNARVRNWHSISTQLARSGIAERSDACLLLGGLNRGHHATAENNPKRTRAQTSQRFTARVVPRDPWPF